MEKSLGPGLAQDLLLQARTELLRIAIMINSLSDRDRPSLDLLEAERSIHNALIALDEWRVSREDVPPAPVVSHDIPWVAR